MKLSLLSFSFQTERLKGQMDGAKLCRLAKDNGIDTVDLMSAEVQLYGMENLKRAFAASGVSCGCIIAPLPFYKSVEQFPKKLTEALDLCGALGVKSLMVIPGYGDEAACKLLRREEMISRAVELFTMAVNRAAERNVEILFEDTPQAHKPLAAVSDCRAVLDGVPGLGFVFDTGNFIVAETDADLLAAYDALKDRIRRVHLKDVVRGSFPSGEACVNGERIRTVPTGSGIVPLRPFVEKLVSDGYDGTVCIEYAAGKGVHGLDHAKYIAGYVRNIRTYETGDSVTPPYGQIPGVDKPVSRIFFGTAILPMLMGKDASAILDAALAAGINAFDCARGYGNAEKSLGNWVRARNNRERVVLLTKCGNVDRKGNVQVNRAVIEKELAKSLQALQTDYIDIYLLHRDDPNTPVSEFIDTLNQAKRQGKIRVFGVSNWTVERIREANEYAAANRLDGFAVSSPNFGLARQMADPWGGGCVTISGPEHAADRAWYAETQMPVLAYSSLGRGFFGGRFQSFDETAAKKVLDGPAQKGYLCPENMRRLRNAEALAKRDRCTVPQTAMRYVFGSGMDVYALVSTTNPVRIPENIAAAWAPLSGEDAAFLEADEA